MQLNRSTIYQWQEVLTFQCFFNQQKQDIREEMRNELFSLGKMAVNILRDCMKSNDSRLRLKASLAVIEKIENASIGDYNARKILKEKASSAPFDWGLDEAVLNEEKYKSLLKEYRLK